MLKLATLRPVEKPAGQCESGAGVFVPVEKIKASERNIRFLKSVTGILARVIHKTGTANSHRMMELVRMAVCDARQKNKEVNIALFDLIFKDGDTRDSATLTNLRKVIETEEKV